MAGAPKSQLPPDSPRQAGRGGAIRRTTYFSGCVQGVGFRYTVQEIASRFDLTGVVRNLRDGRVELVAEGAAGELDRFQAAIEEAMRSHIEEVKASDSAATGEFRGFSIDF